MSLAEKNDTNVALEQIRLWTNQGKRGLNSKSVRDVYVQELNKTQEFLASKSISVDTSAFASTSIKVQLGAGSVFACAESLTVAQNAQIHIMSALSAQTSDLIVFTRQVIENFTKALGQAIKASGSVTGAVEFQQTLAEVQALKDIDLSVIINQVVNVINRASASQELTLAVGDNSFIKAQTCILSQNMFISLVTQSIVALIIGGALELKPIHALVQNLSDAILVPPTEQVLTPVVKRQINAAVWWTLFGFAVAILLGIIPLALSPTYQGFVLVLLAILIALFATLLWLTRK